MTTQFLDNKMSTFKKNYIVVAFPKKNSVFGRVSSLPPIPPPPRGKQIIFLLSSCRL